MSSNWELCRMARFLNDTLKIPAPFVDKHVGVQGREKEDIVAERHPEWITHQQTMTLPNGRKCRIDFLDENGCPVEVKGMSQKSWERFNTAEDFLAAPYKYQVEYLIQLSAYCVLTDRPGRFVMVTHETMEEKEVAVPLDMAKDVWNKFQNWEINIPSCSFCKMEQGCTVFCKLRKYKRDPNAFNKHTVEEVV